MINNDSRNKFTALNIPAHFNFEKKNKVFVQKAIRYMVQEGKRNKKLSLVAIKSTIN